MCIRDSSSRGVAGLGTAFPDHWGVPIVVSVATTLALVVVYQPLRCATFDDSTYLRGP